MAVVFIPTSNTDSLFWQTTTLEGRSYLLTFRWAERSGRWTLDISHDGEVLAAGIRLVADWPLLQPYKSDPLLPQGELFALDFSGQGLDPRLRDLGDRVELVYFETTEFEEAA